MIYNIDINLTLEFELLDIEFEQKETQYTEKHSFNCEYLLYFKLGQKRIEVPENLYYFFHNKVMQEVMSQLIENTVAKWRV